ncbi:heavy metal translocating P-type ATPase [Paenibacillus sp. MZ04-78.2]|uniref:heavy metal translocating P-type ATPase n=1 Tax=Paenibacillus sp. MZ04-78.2 TaxID=2962034 RepID=UPI0020B8CFB2|nr:heavy metal translocating P-type ATPase [Paenibacillus sp. MZ04-78.2]MCP3772679.1 heavy metal translocating P-type ATPase [Paenibacillus sp. MZ04-78.2]
MIHSVDTAQPIDKPEVKRKKGQIVSVLSRYGEAIAALASGILIAAAWVAGHSSPSFSIWLYCFAFLIGGFVKAKEGWLTLVREKDLDVNLLMIVAAIGAASIGYWMEGAVLIFIFSLSGALETFTMEKSSRDISSLMDLKPETAIVWEEGAEKRVPVEQLRIGELVLVKPGERLPADGIVQEGSSAVNQASITGESIPVDKVAGDEVFAGTLNGQGALFVQVTKSSESTLFSKIIRLVQEAQSEMPKSQRFIERFERLYARVIILATLLLIALPPWLFGWSWNDTLYRAMVFLVVASPCALVASIMPAMLSAISNSARKGLLFKGGAHLERASHIRAIAFDKTGTLTYGKPSVTDFLTYQAWSEEELLRIAASIESLSTHPIAKAIVDRAEQLSLELERPSDFQALAGWGVQAGLAGELWKIGKPGFFEETGIDGQVLSDVRKLEQEGKTVVLIQNTAGIAGMIALQDAIRPQARETVAKLKELGVQVVMLTGDQRLTAEAIAREAGIDQVYAGLLPEDKLNIVKTLKEKYTHVAMVGDGINDAPALAAASVGIAMGAAGSDAALETADLVLMNDDLDKIKEAIVLGRRTTRIIKQNIAFAVTVIAFLIAANFFKGIPLPLGVVGHEGSTILVILNGLRLLRS